MYVATSGPYGLSGFGDAAQAAQTVQLGGSIAAGTASAILGALTTGGATTILGITSAAVPVIGAALMGATLLVSYLVKNSGCGITCVETSEWANKAAAALQQNLDAYKSLPAPRTQAQQAVALANFDVIWQQLQQACGQPGTGNAGVRCITDRQRGACTWKNNGQCWDWFIGYRDPIANDTVVPDPPVATSVSGSIDSLFSAAGASGSLLPLLLIGGLALWAVKS